MPRIRNIETGIEPQLIDGSWYCGICNQQKGKTKRDCKYHQAGCLHLQKVLIQDEKFGLLHLHADKKIISCAFCEYTDRNRDNAYRHSETVHSTHMPVGEKRLYIKNKTSKYFQ